MKEHRQYYPIMADIGGRECVVVGGGAVGWRKAASLLECGARVVVVSPEGVPAIAAAAAAGTLVWHRRAFRPGDLSFASLAFAATDDPATNAAVRAEAQRLGVWLNAAYDADQGDFIVPSSVRRGRLLMTVTTCGASPKLARRIAGAWSETYGPEYADYVELLERLRRFVLTSAADENRKLACLGELLQMGLLDQLRTGTTMEEVYYQATAALSARL
ncbi:bifunctional precorrin-2 dehydrogenase/sirohydrochlorin ferrochelatase [Paenibacillus sp. TRM 82003]|nr:bifunctional precorrin-2 dehydrogenase/sirohydrochlorin ferrochelatase [Paenibacillus sp. TRM 82003]